jgi:hypothetical protein
MLRVQPDLVIAEIRAVPPAVDPAAGAKCGLILPVIVKVKNLSPGQAGSFEVSMEYQTQAEGGGVVTRFHTVPFWAPTDPGSSRTFTGRLARGATVDLSGKVTLPRTEAGKMIRLRAKADSTGRVAELDETNNTKATAFFKLTVR